MLIPKTRAALRLAEHELGWMEREARLGPGTRRRVQPAEIHPDPDAVGRSGREHGFPGAVAAAQPCGRPAAFGRRSEKPLCRRRDLGDRHRLAADRRVRAAQRMARNRSSPSSNRRRSREGSMPSWRDAANGFSPGAAPTVMPKTAPAPAPRSRSPKSATDPEHVLAWRQRTPIA